MAICDNCIHDEVCGLEGHLDEALTFCANKVADVQPIRHGRWETWGYVLHGIKWKRCSLCHKTADVSYSALIEGKIKMATSAICGCCGARMDVIYQDDKIRAIKVT